MSHPYLKELRIRNVGSLKMRRPVEWNASDDEDEYIDIDSGLIRASWVELLQKLLDVEQEINIEVLELTSADKWSIFQDGKALNLESSNGVQMRHLRKLIIDEGVGVRGAHREDLEITFVPINDQPIQERRISDVAA